MTRVADLPLRGAGGESVDFARTIVSHGVAKSTKTVAHMFRLDEDLYGFYELVRDGEFAWCALGAGRILRAPTVFEHVVKTICTPIRMGGQYE